MRRKRFRVAHGLQSWGLRRKQGGVKSERVSAIFSSLRRSRHMTVHSNRRSNRNLPLIVDT